VPLETPDAFKLLKAPLFQGDEWIWLAEIRDPDNGPIIAPDGTESVLRLARRTSPVVFGVNIGTGEPLTWAPWPFKIDDIPQDSKGNVSELRVTLANGAGVGDALMHDNAYLRGYRLLLHIVHSALLDQPNAKITVETSIVAGAVTWESISLQLSAFGLLDFSIPTRLMTRKCGWRYRGPGCGFIGDPGNVELGPCVFTVEACELRGQWEEDHGLVVAHPGNFGGWPALLAGPLPAKLA
jgi:phage-related protein